MDGSTFIDPTTALFPPSCNSMMGIGTFDSSGVSGPVLVLLGPPSVTSTPDGPSSGAIFNAFVLFFFQTRNMITTHTEVATIRVTRSRGMMITAGDIPVRGLGSVGGTGEGVRVGMVEDEGRGEGVEVGVGDGGDGIVGGGRRPTANSVRCEKLHW